jgi:hypothetical protein
LSLTKILAKKTVFVQALFNRLCTSAVSMGLLLGIYCFIFIFDLHHFSVPMEKLPEIKLIAFIRITSRFNRRIIPKTKFTLD